MKKCFNSIITVVLSVIVLSSCQQQGGSTDNVKIKNDLDSASYAFGLYVANTYKGQFKEINSLAVAKAIDDVYNNSDVLFTMEEVNAYLTSYLQGKADESRIENKERGEEFLTENRSKPGVVEIMPGLQYLVIEEGVGPSPKAEDKVKVHYKGTLMDGTVFDSSYDRGSPAEFKLNQVIRGWTEALQLMKQGSKWTIYIGSELAYGENGSRSIGPNETLIFEVELLEIINE